MYEAHFQEIIDQNVTVTWMLLAQVYNEMTGATMDHWSFRNQCRKSGAVEFNDLKGYLGYK